MKLLDWLSANWFRDPERAKSEATMRAAWAHLAVAIATSEPLTPNQRVQLSEMFRTMSRSSVTVGEVKHAAEGAAAAFPST